MLPGSALAQDVSAAARAYRRGQEAFLREDFASAADFFEMAHDIVPSAEALRSAVRARFSQGRLDLAADLAMRLADDYTDEDSQQLGNEVLRRARSSLGLLTVECTVPCTIGVDGAARRARAARTHRLFVPPGERVLVASFQGRNAAPQRVVVRADGERRLLFSPPLAAPADTMPAGPEPVSPQAESAQADVSAQAESPQADVSAPAGASFGLEPWVFAVSAAAAGVAGGVAVWSLVDLLNAADAYRMEPTQARLDAGRGKELRNGVLWGVFGALAAWTLGLGLFGTRWSGPTGGPVLGLRLGPGLGMATLTSQVD